MKGIGYFHNLRNFLEMFWIFSGTNFSGGFFWGKFFGGPFWEEFFGKNYLVEINKEWMPLKILGQFCLNGGRRKYL